VRLVEAVGGGGTCGAAPGKVAETVDSATFPSRGDAPARSRIVGAPPDPDRHAELQSQELALVSAIFSVRDPELRP
jgi:hypothetical protein